MWKIFQRWEQTCSQHPITQWYIPFQTLLAILEPAVGNFQFCRLRLMADSAALQAVSKCPLCCKAGISFLKMCESRRIYYIAFNCSNIGQAFLSSNKMCNLSSLIVSCTSLNKDELDHLVGNDLFQNYYKCNCERSSIMAAWYSTIFYPHASALSVLTPPLPLHFCWSNTWIDGNLFDNHLCHILY